VYISIDGLVDKLIDRSFDSLIGIVKRGTSYHYNRMHVCIVITLRQLYLYS